MHPFCEILELAGINSLKSINLVVYQLKNGEEEDRGRLSYLV